MRILVIEDEEHIAKYILSLLEQHPSRPVVLGHASNLAQGKVLIETTKPDVVLLDINLPDGHAFSLLQELQSIAFHIIFITAYDQYAIQAIKVGALDYILKPFDKEELFAALDKASTSEQLPEQVELTAQAFEEKPIDRLAIKQQEAISMVYLNDLYYCKSDGPYTEFYTSTNEVIVASTPLKEFETRLPKHFIRSHKSYIVNTNKVKQIDKIDDALILDNQVRIPISSRRKKEVIQFILG